MRTAKVPARLCIYTCSYEPSLFADAMIAKLSCTGAYMVLLFMKIPNTVTFLSRPYFLNICLGHVGPASHVYM